MVIQPTLMPLPLALMENCWRQGVVISMTREIYERSSGEVSSEVSQITQYGSGLFKPDNK
jgi:hypothetical protein